MRPNNSLIALILAFCWGPVVAVAEPTHAVYDLYYRGAQAGTVTVTITRNPVRTYYEAIAQPNLLARLLGQGRITERGTVTSDGLRPIEYFYYDAGKDRQYKYIYDWNNWQVLVASGDQQQVLTLTPEIIDPATVALRLIQDLPNLSPNYSVLSRGRLRVYRFDSPIREPIEVLGQKQSTWKVTRVRGDRKDSHITTWHDPTRHQWMVRTVRMEDGDETVRLELSELR